MITYVRFPKVIPGTTEMIPEPVNGITIPGGRSSGSAHWDSEKHSWISDWDQMVYTETNLIDSMNVYDARWRLIYLGRPLPN